MVQTPVLPLHMQRDGFDPVPELGKMRDTEGITKISEITTLDVNVWLVTRYEDIRAVQGNWQQFSTQQGLRLTEDVDEEEIAKRTAGNILVLDPPEHTRLRRMLTPQFTGRRMRRLEPRIRGIVDEHLDAMERLGPPADLVSLFALPIPALVICELLGVPYEDRDDFQERTGKLLDISLSVEERVQASNESRAYMRSLVERNRAEPGDELLGMLVREHGDNLTTDEIVGIAGLLLSAGHETTSNMLSLGALALMRHPEQFELLRREPERVDAAVEELLRWLSIVHSGTSKVVTEEMKIAGQVIKPGDVVACALPAGNRDPQFIDDPERLDITRGSTGHVAFGHGLHHCLGAPLARMEMRIAFPALVNRFPNLHPIDADFRSFSMVYGLTALEVGW